MKYLRATKGDEMERIGPSPRVAAKNRPYFVVILDGGPATAFGFRLVRTDFRTQRHPRES